MNSKLILLLALIVMVVMGNHLKHSESLESELSHAACIRCTGPTQKCIQNKCYTDSFF